MRPPRHLLLPLAFALACAAVLLAPVAGTAAPGDYSVRFTSTNGPQWATYGKGPFIASTSRVHSGHGIFAAGDFRSWRATVLGAGTKIIGGRMGIAMSTPHGAMRGRIVVGTGSSSIVVYDQGVEGAVERTLPAGKHDWVQFDLRAASAVTTSGVGQNFVNFKFAELTLNDPVPPTVEALALPSPTAWHGAGACIGYALHFTDQGGGLLRAQVRRAHDGAVVAELHAPQQESTRPGPTQQQLHDCLQPGEHGHGDTGFIATVWDVGGHARELSFSVRADHRAPSIQGGPGHDQRFETMQPEVVFVVGDDGAGIAHASASVDGRAVPVTVAGDRARVEVGTLGLGGHVVALALVDHAGNSARVERRIVVADTTPPTLSLTSPGARGEATVTVQVRASDAMSGIDPATWALSVDGKAAAFTATGDALSAKLGPLEPGTHRIDVALRDRAGNRAAISRDYYVVPPPPPEPKPEPKPQPKPAAPAPTPAAAPPPPPPGRTGVFLIDGPRRPVGHGRRTSVSVHVVRDGEPVRNHPVELRLGKRVLAVGVTDDAGVARITVTVARPGKYRAHAVGLALGPADAKIRVAPRLVIAVSKRRPRVRERVLLTGRIYPAIRGRRVAVEARVGGVWFPVRRVASTNATGRFRTSVVASAPGPVWVRVRMLAVGAWAPGTSNQRLLTVRR